MIALQSSGLSASEPWSVPGTIASCAPGARGTARGVLERHLVAVGRHDERRHGDRELLRPSAGSVAWRSSSSTPGSQPVVVHAGREHEAPDQVGRAWRPAARRSRRRCGRRDGPARRTAASSQATVARHRGNASWRRSGRTSKRPARPAAVGHRRRVGAAGVQQDDGLHGISFGSGRTGSGGGDAGVAAPARRRAASARAAGRSPRRPRRRRRPARRSRRGRPPRPRRRRPRRPARRRSRSRSPARRRPRSASRRGRRASTMASGEASVGAMNTPASRSSRPARRGCRSPRRAARARRPGRPSSSTRPAPVRAAPPARVAAMPPSSEPRPQSPSSGPAAAVASSASGRGGVATSKEPNSTPTADEHDDERPHARRPQRAAGRPHDLGVRPPGPRGRRRREGQRRAGRARRPRRRAPRPSRTPRRASSTSGGPAAQVSSTAVASIV